MTPAERVDVLASLASEWHMNLDEREALGWAVVMLRNDPQEAPDEALARYIEHLELMVAKQDVQERRESFSRELYRLRNDLFARDSHIRNLKAKFMWELPGPNPDPNEKNGWADGFAQGWNDYRSKVYEIVKRLLQ